jgi:hypothetical protein
VLLGRSIQAKHASIRGNKVQYEEFRDLADALVDIPETEDKQMPVMSGVVTLLGSRGSVLGRFEHLDYDDKDGALRFTMVAPEYSSGNGSDEIFRRGLIRAEFAIGASKYPLS